MIRRLRLISGLVLFSYIFTHFTNHALGLISLGVMEHGLVIVYAFWGSFLGAAAIYTALVTHFLLALTALWARRSLRMPPIEAAQYLLGFSVPLLLAPHVAGTRIADALFDADGSYYTIVLIRIWYLAPINGPLHTLLVVAAWCHACIGLRFWLRSKRFYERWVPYLFATALLMPVLALLGMGVAARDIGAMIAQDPGLLAKVASALSPEQLERLDAIRWAMRGGFVGAVGLLLVARAVRHWLRRRAGVARIVYPDGRSIEVERGVTVLEASRQLGIPHASVCGAKGRCSTCRVRVRGPLAAIPAPDEAEAAVLLRIDAPSDVRLACQLRPTGSVAVAPLLPSTATARDARPQPGYHQGREQEIVILFADLRAFTRFAEGRLPFDVVFVLNRYFASMGRAIEQAGGRVDKFIGDGIMALFGLEEGVESGARQAIEAARLMSENLVELNRMLAHDLGEPLRIGIGIHCGPVIVGAMGYGQTIGITAIGDAVNTASRLEALSKTYACELVVSEDTVARAGLDFSRFAERELEIRGRRAPLVVRTVPRGTDLAGAGSPATKPGIAG